MTISSSHEFIGRPESAVSIVGAQIITTGTATVPGRPAASDQSAGQLQNPRVQFVASQLVGVALAHHVPRLAPFRSLLAQQVADSIGPNLQRYPTGDLSMPR
jgi:hypothetical protein